jgi:hypothetical protein
MMSAASRIGLFALAAALFVPAAASADPSSKMVFKAPHHFSRAEAKMRVQQLLDYWAQRFGVRTNWDGDSAHIRGKVAGVEVDGYLVVNELEVDGEAADPGFPMAGSARNYIQKKLQKYLHPQYLEM